MAFFGGPKTESFLGVDIGAGGLKVVELSGQKGRATLLTYGYSVRKPGEAIVSPFDDPRGTGEQLAKICQRAGVKTTRAMAALPLSSVFSAIISVPRRKDEKEMKPLIDAAVSKLTPLPLAEMITYSTFIDDIGKGEKDAKAAKETKGEKGPKPSDYVRVLVTGAAKTLIQKYIDIFKVAKLELMAIDTEAFALIRSLVGKDRAAILILDLGSMRTNITVVEKGIPFLTRSINVGGSSLTRRLREQMNVTENEAEEMKFDLAASLEADPSAPIPPALEATLQPILNEVQYAFKLYAQMDVAEAKRVEKVIVTGGSSLLPRVPEYLAEKLNLNVYRGNPWARVVYPQDLRPVLEEIGPRMSVAIGLAMREIE